MQLNRLAVLATSALGTAVLLASCASNNTTMPNSGQSYMQSASDPGQAQSAAFSPQQLQSLVSSIALYPDSLLSLMLLGSTYPLEIAEAYNWRRSNASLSGTALQNALKTQTWNDSVKSLISFPQAFNMMGSNLEWTQNLGNAYKLQPADTMKAVQELRKRAQQAGTLKTNAQMTVVNDPNSNILIMPASTQVVYVPSYNPNDVYGPWPYADYPPYPAYNPAWGMMSFGVGMAIGAEFWSTPSWSNGTINVNNNTNSNRPNRGIIGPSSIQNQQRLANDWKNNATAQQKQDAKQLGQRANSDFQKNATAQERQQANQLNQSARADAAQDRANPNVDRESLQENALRSQARSDANQDRFGGDRGGFGGDRGGYGGDRGGFGGGRGGFGGGHFGGGFRR